MPSGNDEKPLLEILAAGIAHEVRNPLNALEINLRILQQELEQVLPDRSIHVYRVLESISSEVRGLDDFVTEFLRFARPPRLKPERVEIRRLLRDLVTFIAPQCAKRGVDLTARFEEGPLIVTVDTFQLKQAILNLVLNALEASVSGGRIEILTGGPAGRLTIEIRDSGEGIPVEASSKIFDVFFTTREGGTGLGLPICRQIAESHGGSLELVSRPGKGTTAILSLPGGGE